jgi:hypothetical protein
MSTWIGACEQFLARWKDAPPKPRRRNVSTPAAEAFPRGWELARDGARIPCAPPRVLCEEIIDGDW